MLVSMILALLSLGQAKLDLPPECNGNDGTACFNAARQIDESTLEGRASRGSAFARACELDVRSGCFNAGIVLSGVARDLQNSASNDVAGARLMGSAMGIASLARSNFIRGCELGHLRACAQASTGLQMGFGGDVDYPRAAQMEVLGCEAGSADLCFWAGTSYAGTELGEPDHEAALSFFLRGCEGGFANACTSARSVMVEADTYPSDAQVPQAILALEGACADEASIACMIRDSFIWTGRDLDAVPSVDTDLVRRAEARCLSQSMTSWCYEVGGMYSIVPLGLNAGQRYAGQLRSYTLACELGSDQACGNFIRLAERLRQTFTGSCEQGDQNSCQFIDYTSDIQRTDDYFVQAFGLVPLSDLEVQADTAQ